MNFDLNLGGQVIKAQSGNYGHLENGWDPKGYSCMEDHTEDGFLWTRKTIYLFELNMASPMMYVLPNGWRLQPYKKYMTDKGSVPRIINWWIPPDDPTFIQAFYFHDGCFLFGHLFLDTGSGVFQKIDVDRVTANRLLCTIALSKGASETRVGVVYSGISMGKIFGIAYNRGKEEWKQ